MVHALVSNALKDLNNVHTKELTKLYNALKKNKELKDKYGLTNLDEFVAEGLTNLEFQEAMSKVKQGGIAGAWNNFVSSIAKMLGLDLSLIHI